MPHEKKEELAYRENQKAELKARVSARPEPDRNALEATLEANEKCGKCGGKIRAICDEFDPTAADASCDAEIKVTLFCRVASCGWQVTQFRSWRASKPEQI